MSLAGTDLTIPNAQRSPFTDLLANYPHNSPGKQTDVPEAAR